MMTVLIIILIGVIAYLIYRPEKETKILINLSEVGKNLSRGNYSLSNTGYEDVRLKIYVCREDFELGKLPLESFVLQPRIDLYIYLEIGMFIYYETQERIMITEL